MVIHEFVELLYTLFGNRTFQVRDMGDDVFREVASFAGLYTDGGHGDRIRVGLLLRDNDGYTSGKLTLRMINRSDGSIPATHRIDITIID